MKLSKLKPNDYFKSYSGTLFQVLPMTLYEKKNNKDRIKAVRIETDEEFMLVDMVVLECKKDLT